MAVSLVRTTDARAVRRRTSIRPIPVGLTAALLVGGAALIFAGHALAQGATAPTGSIGAQMNTISSEAMNAGGTAVSMACYLAAGLCFVMGAWSGWQSRHPHNRETGHIARAIAGITLCGLFAAAPSWINKASVTASGSAPGVTGNAQMVQFGTGN